MHEDLLTQEVLNPTSPALAKIQNFTGTYPKQLWALAFTEMWERFCFYGNRALLTVFMAKHLMMSDGDANLKYGSIQAFVYAFTFIGGLFADKILGFKKSLLWGGLLMILSSLLLFINPETLFFPGICLLIIGTGFFKPNISTMVGELYKTGDARRDAGFGLFYSFINIGALFAGIVCVWAYEHYGANVSFGLSGLFMAIGLFVFLITKKDLGPIGNVPAHIAKSSNGKKYEWLVYLGSVLVLPIIYLLITNTKYTDLFMYIIGPATLIYLFIEMRKYTMAEQKKLWAALIFIFFSIFFWAFFEQSGGSLNLFAADNLHRNLLGFTISPLIVNNASNAFFVILFSPILGLAWVTLAKKKLEPNGVIKFGIAFLFLALAFYIFYYTKFFADTQGKTSLNVFTLAYFVITFGELALSPIGLSLMTKLSPKPLWGVMMGMWFLASAYGQYVAGILGAGMSSANPNETLLVKLATYCAGYKQLAIYALIAGIILIIISPVIRKLMQEVK
jgi:POT family proton-dependent oligopeptide transporter